MTDKTISGLTTISSVDPAVDVIEISDISAASSNKVTRNGFLGITSTPTGINDSQTLTNKIVTAPTISSPVLSGTITGTYTIGGTPTFPSSVVTLTGSQTLTNKILTSPTINTATIVNPTLTVDAVTGFSTSNSGTVFGLTVTTGSLSIPSNLTVTGTSTLTGNATASGTLGTVGQLSVQTATAPPAAGTSTAGIKLSSTANLGVFFGSGAPTFSAAQGAVYLRTDGSSTSTRMYVNTTGSTTWTSFTSAA